MPKRPPPPLRLSSRFERALAFANQLHRKQPQRHSNPLRRPPPRRGRAFDDPIADDWWKHNAGSTPGKVTRVTIGRPVPLPDGSDWYCPISIEGFHSPKVQPSYGVGPVDSLMNAMHLVKVFFEVTKPTPRSHPPPH
jgi:hypothetical protein